MQAAFDSVEKKLVFAEKQLTAFTEKLFRKKKKDNPDMKDEKEELRDLHELEDDEKDPEFDPRFVVQPQEYEWDISPKIKASDDAEAQLLKAVELSRHKPQVIIVGAGPVGLWVSIQLKMLCPDMEILLFDKHETFQRSHLLRVQKSSLQKVNKKLDSFRKWAVCLTGKIRTNDLEKRLWEKATELGIKKEILDIKNPLELKEKFPTAKIIIGTDGSHSIVRHEVFGNKLAHKETVEHVCFVKYEVEGKAEPLNGLKEMMVGFRMSNHLVLENIGKEKDGITPITLQIKIDADTYKKMEGAKFKTPYNITTDKPKYDPKLLETITAWLNIREIYKGEKRVKGSAKVTVISLDVYKAAEVGKHLEDKDLTVFLCGDAAFGLPFFRALNDGMLFGSALASAIAKYPTDMKQAIKSYSNYFEMVTLMEIASARSIALSHKAADGYMKFEHALPLQLMTFKSEKADIHKPLPDVEE